MAIHEAAAVLVEVGRASRQMHATKAASPVRKSIQIVSKDHEAVGILAVEAVSFGCQQVKRGGRHRMHFGSSSLLILDNPGA